ncbi:serine/threonine-protein kinase [Pseudoduganella violaceinigra]|uniref:serine/threonine-protein kinase n=1 Tax=Pseudoduganella violaceinigra TaxID=246602 RepID=UPI0003F6C320|nr:serine/threonine-protein kinase [Pseudoduganella violaceinigra]
MNKAVELPNSLPIGTRVAEFEIREVIGEGGFGIVYLAFDHSLQRTVAVKEYMPAALAARSTDQTVQVRSKRHAEAFHAGLRSFINEARLLAQFDHPALVKVYRFWEQHGTAYMAMRYYEGRTFKSVVHDHPELVTEAWLKQLLKPILGALDALYAAKILHRDVSPENIMIQPDGQPVLLDFGAARQIVQDMAQSLTVILKPGFAPVEQYADDESMRQGPWTDIYSLSAVVYAAITGKAPPAAVARMLNDPVEPLSISGRTGYDMQFLEAIDRGMAVRPEIRPQTIAEFAELLGLDGLAGATSSPTAVSGHTPVASLAAAAGAPVPPPASAPQAASTPQPAAAPQAASAPQPASSAGGGGSASRQAASPGSASSAKASRSGDRGAPAFTDPEKRSRRAKPPVPLVGKSGAKPGKQAASSGRKLPAKNTMIAAGLGAMALVVLGLTWFADGSPVVPAASEAASAASQPATNVASAPAVAVPAADTPAVADAGASAPAEVPAEQPAVDAASATAPAAQASAAAVAAEVAAPASGTVSITVQPWATIYVDGVQYGVTPPLKKLTLPLGNHEIRLVNPNFPAYVQKVTVDAKKPVTIKHDFGA